MSYGQGVKLQYCPIQNRLNFFQCGHKKLIKINFFHKTLIPRNLLKEQNIQDRPCEELGFGGNISPFRDLDETSTILLNY